MKSKISIEGMMEAGMHFGHQTFRRNPKMDPYIFDSRDGIHIIDLTKTEPLLQRALEFIGQLAEEDKQVIFVGTKKQAGPIIKTLATQCGMPYVDERWMGGLLTNYDTLKKRLKYLRELDEKYAKNDFGDMNKKEIAGLNRVYRSLQVSLGGLRELHGLPAAVFVVSTLQDAIAVREARKLHIPVIAIVDTNSDPTQVDYPIPGNDDAKKAIAYVVGLMAEACKVSPKVKTADTGSVEEASAGPELTTNMEKEVPVQKASLRVERLSESATARKENNGD